MCVYPEVPAQTTSEVGYKSGTFPSPTGYSGNESSTCTKLAWDKYLNCSESCPSAIEACKYTERESNLLFNQIKARVTSWSLIGVWRGSSGAKQTN
jgi:hypothetical protein